MNGWVDLEHRLWQELKENSIQDKKILVGFSGGADSLSLLWSLKRVKKQNFEACFVHHGAGNNKEYRDQALVFCRDFCRTHGILFHERIHSGDELHSEAALRDFRYEALTDVQKEIGAEILALGHHREDLLETRLLRLIRGTGPQGLVAMTILQDGIFRPFLRISKSDLSLYLNHFKLCELTDPSNLDLEPFRNWIRNEWLAALELRQSGAVNALARSLEVLAESQLVARDFSGVIRGNCILRGAFLAESRIEQKRVLAGFLLKNNAKNFSQAHLEEILKRLDNSQKVFTFEVAGLVWLVNAQQIRVQESI